MVNWGEELNSVMEQTPGLADAIAKGLGITTAELKAMGKAGELAIPKVIEALKKRNILWIVILRSVLLRFLRHSRI